MREKKNRLHNNSSSNIFHAVSSCALRPLVPLNGKRPSWIKDHKISSASNRKASTSFIVSPTAMALVMKGICVPE